MIGKSIKPTHIAEQKILLTNKNKYMSKSITRFRAYQLTTPGSSYSYAVDDYFILIEARYNDSNKASIREEMNICGCKYITKLHITSWDDDHCNPNELSDLLANLLPTEIEMPGYPAATESARSSKALIEQYVRGRSYASSTEYTPTTIHGLSYAEARKYTDIIYNPKMIGSNANDNSTVKLFRRGRFTVLSLGDCEAPRIGQYIMNDSIVQTETDVMIVAHHGSDNSIMTTDFVSRINPQIAICTSNYDNQFNHPTQRVRAMFGQRKLYTTKRGDVIIVCGEDNVGKAYNLVENNTTIEDEYKFTPKLLID